MKNINSSFICCQIGAREHYIIPRILFEKNLLRHLYTDIWLNPKQIISKLAYRFTSRLSGRHDKFLADCKPDTIKIGLSFFEAEDSIYDVFESDIQLDYCVTPDKIYGF